MSNKEVAQTILSQIKAIDFWALGSWAARNYTILNDQMGGVQFKINCPKLKNAFVQVVLNGSDLYDIRFFKVWGGKITVDETVNDVYAENLVNVIDGRVG